MRIAAENESPLTQRTAHSEKIFRDGASRLLARAADDRSLTTAQLARRIGSAVEKYMLRDDPQATSQAIDDFIDKLQADDLCLIVACEHGDQKAWNDLVERFSATVRSAA